ncbi:MAG: 5'/3'-nucleotidase SurE [Deltaproteobacteria bacterium]|nr:5'/3'-nucleotidase SurE [Deltaproteobacteria bacterium]
MKILLTNDDGIHAPGLMSLHGELSIDHEVNIVAPEAEMSAVGHAITLTSPLRVQKVNKNGTFYGYGVSGTPADCVKIAVQELIHPLPDVILSGINLGANVGVNVLYSGTVSAATEGAFLGIRSAAISLNTRQDPDFSFAAQFSRKVIQLLMENVIKVGTALNVNVPALPRDKIKGVIITRQGVGKIKERFERRMDPRGNVYYWLSGEIPVNEEAPDADVNALRADMISITPIGHDLTCEGEIDGLRSSKFSF